MISSVSLDKGASGHQAVDSETNKHQVNIHDKVFLLDKFIEILKLMGTIESFSENWLCPSSAAAVMQFLTEAIVADIQFICGGKKGRKEITQTISCIKVV